MSDSWDAVYLSPHLDDAALSCGGQISARARAGEKVLVLTLFTADEPAEGGSDLIETLHGLFGLQGGVVAHRRGEDLAACEALGAEPRHVPLAEAIYRTDSDGHFLYTAIRAIFSSPSSADSRTVEALAEVMAAFREVSEVFVPLGVGGHVDHVLTRSAAELVFDELSYYEEIPYVEKWGALRRALGRRADWQPAVAGFDDVDLDAKIEACLAYGSQIEGLYRTPERLEAALRKRTRKLGGERLWRH